MSPPPSDTRVIRPTRVCPTNGIWTEMYSLETLGLGLDEKVLTVYISASQSLQLFYRAHTDGHTVPSK